MTFVWTRRAVGQYRRHLTYDPAHTAEALSVDPGSPWLTRDMAQLANNSPWILIDPANGHIVAGSPDYYTC